MNELNSKVNETNSKVALVIPDVEKNLKNNDKFDTDFKKMEIKFADIEANLQSLIKLTTDHDTDIKDTKTKLKDFNILELLKAIGEDGNKSGENNNIILTLLDNLDKKYDTKMKVTDEKLTKIEESNFKMEKDIQNITNTQDINRRNIDNNKKTEEEMYIKLKELERKLNTDMFEINHQNRYRDFDRIYNDTMTNIVPEANENVNANANTNKESLTKEKEDNNSEEKIINSIENNLIISKHISMHNNNIKEDIKILDDKIREIIKKIIDIEKHFRFLPNQSWVEDIKKEINYLKENKNKFALNVDLNETINRTDELNRQIKYLKEQYNDLANNQNYTMNDEFQSLKKKFELSVNKIVEFEEIHEELENKINQNKQSKATLSERSKQLLEIKVFEEFKTQIIKEFTNVNDNFTHIRKIIDDIKNVIKTKSSFKDLKLFEDELCAKMEDLRLSCTKKFSDRVETFKNIKYLDQQIKNLVQVYLKKIDKNDNWLLAKKPIGNLCASCESYIGDLKDNYQFLPWYKYPPKDQGDKAYRLGNGFSKMLQMMQMDENDKSDKKNSIINTKNTNSNNVSNNQNELSEYVKNMKIEKSELDIISGEMSPSKTTTNNLFKSPQNNLPRLKKGILTKNKSGVNIYQTINSINNINTNIIHRNDKEIRKSYSGTMDITSQMTDYKNNKAESLPDEIDFISPPKITKIKKIIKSE